MRRHQGTCGSTDDATPRRWWLFAPLTAALLAQFTFAAEAVSVDVLVYGGTPGGIAAALGAAGGTRSVLLVEPTDRIGGLVTSGLSHTDFHSFESLTGAFLAFAQRVERFYAEKYGEDSPQRRDSFRGTHGEPHVNLLVFEALLAERPQVTIQRGAVLRSVMRSPAGDLHRIDSITLATADGREQIVRARVFIDATYEGDLLAAAGVPWRAGREGRDEYGESLAPPQADDQLQAYNFRFIMTDDPDNRVTPQAPPGYRREDFLDLLPVLASGQIQKVFDYPRNCIFKAHLPALPNRKRDINDVSNGLVRLSLPGQNLGWPDGDAETRRRIFAEHLRDQAGLLYFLQNDPDVPERFRNEARTWGWCRDEFIETGHLPPQLYVREARRMVGRHVFIQRDSEHAPGDARALLHRDAVAMGDYGNNCHGTGHEGSRFGGRHTGEFYNPVPPYQIPYGVLVPNEIDNLLVPVAVSSSHVGFCALRLEPIWMSLGQAAGHAAAMAVEDDRPVQSIPVAMLQRRLHADGSATIYVSDVLPGQADFAAVQWWGLQGGLHGVEPPPAGGRVRGKSIISQYSEAAPAHAAELDRPLTDELRQRWRDIAAELHLPVDRLPSGGTRGEFIRAAFQAASRRTP